MNVDKSSMNTRSCGSNRTVGQQELLVIFPMKLLQMLTSARSVGRCNTSSATRDAALTHIAELAVCWATVSSQLSHPVILRHKLQNGILISGVDRHCLSDTRLIKCVCVFTEPTRVLVPSLLILYQTLFDIFPFVFCFLGIWQMYGPWRTKCLCAFQVVTPEKYEVKGSIEEAAIVLTACAEPKMQVTITLTSPVIREESGRDGGWKPITALPPSLLFVSPLSCSLSL